MQFGLSAAAKKRVKSGDAGARSEATTPLSAVKAFPGLTFSQPLFLAAPPDGTDRLFVLEKPGRMVWFNNNASTTTFRTALDLRGAISDDGEEGLLGMAFHPRFIDNHWVYVYFSSSSPRRNIVARYTFDAQNETVDPASRTVILESTKPYSNHNGGMMAFGPDGYLYIAIGDGGNAGDPDDNGQDKGTILGKILRIDVDGGTPYAVPADNPFVGKPGVREEIWAFGLRNPWRFSFDRLKGDLWVGDVGQSAWEEINYIPTGFGGGNYGWSAREGKHSFKGGGPGGMIDPVVEHDRLEARSITGGYVYRGLARLPDWSGYYVYGDFATGYVWGLRMNGGKVADHRLLADTGRLITSFGEDRDGEIYFTDFNGEIYTFRD